MRVQLLFFPTCPNVSAARERLHEAFERCALVPSWEEVDLDARPELKRFGSPTVLIDGQDVSPDSAQQATSTTCCRVYPDSDIRGVPPLTNLVAALRDR